jgi:hypothetical protein
MITIVCIEMSLSLGTLQVQRVKTSLNLFQVNSNDITTLGNAPVYERSLYKLNLFQADLVGCLPVRGAADGDVVDGDQVVLHGRNRFNLHYNHLSRTWKCNR